jgi:hypothetical protein
MKKPAYTVTTWNHERQRFDGIEVRCHSIFGVRTALRRLRKSWSDCGILVRRSDLPIGVRPGRRISE